MNVTHVYSISVNGSPLMFADTMQRAQQFVSILSKDLEEMCACSDTYGCKFTTTPTSETSQQVLKELDFILFKYFAPIYSVEIHQLENIDTQYIENDNQSDGNQ